MTQLDQLTAAPAELIAQRALQERVDTKFVFHRSVLDELWATLADHYAVVMSAERPTARYKNLYFDTQARSCLREHHRGRRPRYKVRIRHHLDREMSFLEVKERRSNEITRKRRMPIAFMREDLDEASLHFIRAHARLPDERLQESLRIDFQRLTLVGIDTHERITFDTSLSFSTGEDTSDLPHGVIAEVKQARFKPRTPIMLALRGAGALPLAVSKYCTGAQLLLPNARLHRYRPRLRMLKRRFHD